MRKYITLSIVGAASNYAVSVSRDTGSFIHCFFNGFWISTKKPQPDLCMKTKSQLFQLLSNTTLRIKAHLQHTDNVSRIYSQSSAYPDKWRNIQKCITTSHNMLLVA